jgi:fructosamine-3-kinase
MDSELTNQNVQEALLREKIDPCLTSEVLTALAAEALGARVRCDGFSILTGGCWNRVIAVSLDNGKKHLVFKITPRIGDADLRREFEVLRHFRTHTRLPVPEALLLDCSAEKMPGSLLVMEKLAGTVLQDLIPHLSRAQRDSIAQEVAGHLADLHTHQAKGFGGVEVPEEQRSPTWAGFWLPRFDAVMVEVREKGVLPDDVLVEINAVRPDFPRLLQIGACGSLTHYDIWTGNVMVDFKADRPTVSGFLDGFGYYADYARELSAMFSLADEAFMQAYQQRHALDEGFQTRFNIYSLKMCLQMVCMYPNDPAHRQSVSQFLSRIQAGL